MKPNHFPLIIFLPLLLVLVSCGLSTSDDLTFKSTDQERLGLLLKILDDRNIPYEQSGGTVQYKREVKVEFEKAEKALASAASVQYVDPDLRNFFHALLLTEGIEFLELDREGGSWTLWWADSKDREMEILNRVVEYQIERRMEEDLDCESGSDEDPMKPSFIQDALISNESI